MRKLKKTRKTKKTKKRKSNLVILFIVFELVFTAVTGPYMLYYGPFKNAKTTVVGAAMTTLTLQWLATTFLSDEKIKEIMKDQSVETVAQANLDDKTSGVKVENKDDDRIERYDIKGKKYKGYVLIISDPTRIKVGFSSKLGKEGQLTSEIAKANNAVAAINGGAFTDKAVDVEWAGTGANPTGIIMANGKIEFDDIKDENKRTQVVALTKAGKLLVGLHSIAEMKEVGVTEALSFGPAMIVNGKKMINNNSDGAMGIAPRTAIAQRQDGAIILLVIDGRQLRSIGATLKEAQDVLFEYGAYNAVNLDGGSSSTLFYDDEILNNPCDNLGERSVASIIYVERR